MATFVSDTSPIINLAVINHLYILQLLYGHLIIPEAVYLEIVVQGAGQAGASDVQTEPWFEPRSVVNSTAVTTLLSSHPLLSRAEAEAIVLAVELQADRLLIDEMEGRHVAVAMGVPVRGLLGVLAEAKYQGLIPLVRPLLDELISEAGFFIAHPLYAQVLQDVGE